MAELTPDIRKAFEGEYVMLRNGKVITLAQAILLEIGAYNVVLSMFSFRERRFNAPSVMEFRPMYCHYLGQNAPIARFRIKLKSR